MKAEYFQATPYKLSVDENDPIHQWRIRSKNLASSNQVEKEKSELIDKILHENEDNDSKPAINQNLEIKKLDKEIPLQNPKDFEEFIQRSKSILNNMKIFNETVKKSELNIEILTAKTNLQNKLNELTLNKDFKTQEREKIKEQISELANLEAEIKKKENSSHSTETNSTKIEQNYKIEVHAPENRVSDKEIKRKDTSEFDSAERESKISISSFIDHKKGISHVNRIFNLENEKKAERKPTEFDYFHENMQETSDGKKTKNSRRLFESRFKKQLEIFKFKEKPSVVLTVILFF